MSHPSLRRRTFFEDERPPAVAWHGFSRNRPDWSPESRWLAMHLLPVDGDDDIFLVANGHGEPHEFELPLLGPGKSWRLAVDTMREPPEDIAEPGEEAALPRQEAYGVGPRSVVVLVGR